MSTVLHRESTHSILEELRRRGPFRDFPARFPAAAIQAGQDPVPLLEGYKVDGRPIFWFAPEGLSVMVDQSVFSGLEVVDATSLSVGELREIGTLSMPSRLPLHEVTVLLVMADVVLTYVHIGSSLSMAFSIEDGVFRAECFGHHVYYTAEENRSPLHFDVRIGPHGNMAVVGLP